MKRFIVTGLIGFACLAPLMGCVAEPYGAYVATPAPVYVGPPVVGPPVVVARPRYYRRGYYGRPRGYWRHNYRQHRRFHR